MALIRFQRLSQEWSSFQVEKDKPLDQAFLLIEAINWLAQPNAPAIIGS
jgi:hypothetical protein|tara:strand:+ start:2573 stop:2719 length:147 start_codon:yes stop_codon:yes gene_type:complete